MIVRVDFGFHSNVLLMPLVTWVAVQGVSVGVPGCRFLPARLAHAGELAAKGELAKGDAGDSELVVVSLRATRDRAAVVLSGRARIAGELREAVLGFELVFHRRVGILQDLAEHGTLFSMLRDQLQAFVISVDLRLFRHWNALLHDCLFRGRSVARGVLEEPKSTGEGAMWQGTQGNRSRFISLDTRAPRGGGPLGRLSLIETDCIAFVEGPGRPDDMVPFQFPVFKA
jgi:hypothetical protein